MVENHEHFFILGLVQAGQSKDKEQQRGNDLLNLSSWIKSGNENVQGANDENASQ